MNTIRLGNEEYPYHVNWKSIEMWENETGKEMQDLLDTFNKYKGGASIPSGKDMMLIVKFCYFAIHSGFKKSKKDFEITMDDFAFMSEISDLEQYMKIIVDGMNLQVTEESENKGQPKAKTV